MKSLAWHRELSLKELDELKAKAKRGNLRAVRGIVSFSVWKKVSKLKITEEEKIKAHDSIMKVVNVKVQKNG